jgi:hypothetical protein
MTVAGHAGRVILVPDANSVDIMIPMPVCITKVAGVTVWKASKDSCMLHWVCFVIPVAEVTEKAAEVAANFISEITSMIRPFVNRVTVMEICGGIRQDVRPETVTPVPPAP